MTGPRALRLLEALDVYCWCESQVAKVATADVRAGRTWVCGHLFCVPLEGHGVAVAVGVQSGGERRAA